MATLYSGNDTYCTPIDVGVREDGVAFWRSYGYNGYGNSWSRWEPLENYELNEDGSMKWGWNKLKLIGESSIRLPRPSTVES